MAKMCGRWCALPVHWDKAPLVYFYARFLCVNQLAIGPAANSNQHAAIDLRLWSILTVECRLDALFGSFQLRNFHAQQDLLVALLDTLLQDPYQIPVRSGIRVSVSSTTVIFTPRASYTQAISSPMMPPPITSIRSGKFLEFQGAGGIHDARIVRQARDARRLGIPAAMMHCSKLDHGLLTVCSITR